MHGETVKFKSASGWLFKKKSITMHGNMTEYEDTASFTS